MHDSYWSTSASVAARKLGVSHAEPDRRLADDKHLGWTNERTGGGDRTLLKNTLCAARWTRDAAAAARSGFTECCVRNSSFCTGETDLSPGREAEPPPRVYAIDAFSRHNGSTETDISKRISWSRLRHSSESPRQRSFQGPSRAWKQCISCTVTNLSIPSKWLRTSSIVSGVRFSGMRGCVSVPYLDFPRISLPFAMVSKFFEAINALWSKFTYSLAPLTARAHCHASGPRKFHQALSRHRLSQRDDCTLVWRSSLRPYSNRVGHA